MRKIGLYISINDTFDPELLKRFLHTRPEFFDLKEHLTNCPLQSDILYENDTSTMRLSDDCSFIWIYGTGPATLRAVVLIQRYLNIPLHLIDDGYNFSIVVDERTEPEDIVRKMKESVYE